MANCENGRLRRELEQREKEWERQREEANNERMQRKKELKAELEQQRKEVNFCSINFIFPCFRDERRPPHLHAKWKS